MKATIEIRLENGSNIAFGLDGHASAIEALESLAKLARLCNGDLATALGVLAGAACQHPESFVVSPTAEGGMCIAPKSKEQNAQK